MCVREREVEEHPKPRHAKPVTTYLSHVHEIVFATLTTRMSITDLNELNSTELEDPPQTIKSAKTCKCKREREKKNNNPETNVECCFSVKYHR